MHQRYWTNRKSWGKYESHEEGELSNTKRIGEVYHHREEELSNTQGIGRREPQG